MRIDREFQVRFAAGAVLVLVFAAGTALGLVLARNPQPAPPPEVAVEPSAPEFESARPTQPPNGWIIDRLELEAPRRVLVDSVLDHFGATMSRIQKDYRPRYRAVVDSTNQAIRELLTEEQRARYDSMNAEADRRRSHERDPHRR